MKQIKIGSEIDPCYDEAQMEWLNREKLIWMPTQIQKNFFQEHNWISDCRHSM